MENVKLLLERITSRVNANLKEFEFNTRHFVDNTVEFGKLAKFYCFYGITSHHPIFFHFKNSSMAGSYFLGKTNVKQSCIYKSDVRGDELKRKGDIMDPGGVRIAGERMIRMCEIAFRLIQGRSG